MTSPLHRFAHSLVRTVVLTLLGNVMLSNPLLAADKPANHGSMYHNAPSSSLVQSVRNATHQYIDVNNAVSAGYGPFLGCVAGPDHGAMGIHYVNPNYLGATTVDVTHPQAVIYEPQGDGTLRLVGVEYILDATTWLAANSNTPPVLDGQVFNYVAAPNRFNIPAFFELHVWAWRDNPQGAFVDWNNHVSCEKQ